VAEALSPFTPCGKTWARAVASNGPASPNWNRIRFFARFAERGRPVNAATGSANLRRWLGMGGGAFCYTEE